MHKADSNKVNLVTLLDKNLPTSKISPDASGAPTQSRAATEGSKPVFKRWDNFRTHFDAFIQVVRTHGTQKIYNDIKFYVDNDFLISSESDVFSLFDNCLNPVFAFEIFKGKIMSIRLKSNFVRPFCYS